MDIQFQRHFDNRGRGALVILWPLDYDLGHLHVAMDRLKGILRAVDRVVAFNDIRGIRIPNAKERVFVGEWIEENKTFLAGKLACWADVSESGMVRGALKLVQMWGRDSYPREIIGSEAIPAIMQKYMPDYKKEVKLPNKAEFFPPQPR